MTSLLPRAGYTLPVFACAAAIAALRWLYDSTPCQTIPIDLINPAEEVDIPIEQVAGLNQRMALAIARSDPGDNLDLTRDTPIWALVEWAPPEQDVPIRLDGGEGVGIDRNHQDQAAIYTFAQRLIHTNLQRWLKPNDGIRVTIILPEGRALAKRTSNAAFGVVEGLSLLGTSGISQPLSAPQQLEQFRAELQQKALSSSTLVFCLGENGLNLAQSLGIAPQSLIKTANWLGPMLVEAGQQGLSSILLLGYHGKLIKLAGGIFHTHHHLADARREILTAHCAQSGLPPVDLQRIFATESTEAGLQYLRQLDAATESDWVERIFTAITEQIDRRSQTYLLSHCDQNVQVGSALFDRSRSLFAVSANGTLLLNQLVGGT